MDDRPRRRSVIRLLPPAGAVALFLIGILWEPAATVCIVGAGALVTVAAARGDRFLLGASLLAFGVRAVLAVVSFWLAALDIPALARLVTPPSGGYRFWVMALDSTWYHRAALALITAWQQGTDPGHLIASPEYILFTAITYWLFGPHPLNAALWNALFGALAVVVGYRIAERLGGAAAARPAAAMLALWPSAVLWSTQLLKDSLCLWLILALLYLTIRVMEPWPEGVSWPRAAGRFAVTALALFVTALVLQRFRFYILPIVTPLPLVFVLHALIGRRRRLAWYVPLAVVAVGILLLAPRVANRFDLMAMVTPTHPEVGHVNVAAEHQARGNLAAARDHYHQALGLHGDFPPALKGLGSLAIARGNRLEAVSYLERYLAHAPADAEARAVLESLRGDASLPAAATGRSPLPPLDVDPPPARRGRMILGGPPNPSRAGVRSISYRDAFMIIARMRRGFSNKPSHSAIDPDVQFRGFGDIVRYVPRATANALLTPYPWQWFDTRGSTGALRALSIVEMLLLYAALVPLGIGLVTVVARGSPDALALAIFVVGMTVLLGLTVTNMGTLFRLRLEALFPLFAAGGLGWSALFRRLR